MMDTMEQAIQDFLAAWADGRGASGNTLAAYSTDLLQLRDYLTQRHHIARWAEVEAEHLRAFLTFMLKREYAPTTVARKLAASKAFFRHLAATAALPASPAAALRAPRVTKATPRALDAAAIARLFAQLRTDGPAGLRDGAMLHLLYATGLRVSEVVALNVDDLDGMAGDRAQLVCRGRSGRTRTLPLDAPARAALAVYLDTARPRLLRAEGSAALFVNQRGERLTRQGFWLIVTGYARDAGIVGLTPHTLRHSFALDLITRGVELREVRDLLGHVNLSTTQMYRPLQPQHHDAAPPADVAGDGIAAALDTLDPAVAIALPTDECHARDTALRPGGH